MNTGSPQCIKVDISQGERARRTLKRLGLIASGYRPRRELNYLLIPVTLQEEALKELKASGINGEPCQAVFEEASTSRGPVIDASYVVVGHVAIINPRRGIEDKGYYIRVANDILDNIRRVRSVYLKAGTYGRYRVARLIHLAGDDNPVTLHKEYGLLFRVDLSKVYYNPRLSYEHRRIAENTKDGENVLDMFSGIGGFSIHIASMRRARVLAVDINHYAAAYAAINVELNKKKLKGIVSVVRADAMRLPEIHEHVFDRIIMNNPTMSYHFSSVACTMLRSEGTIHYYTLTLSELEAIDEVTNAFSNCGLAKILGVRRVLDYSPERGVYVVDIRVVKQ